MVFVVDTHALVWYLEESRRLGKRAEAALKDGKSKLVIPTIVLAEIRYLASRQRLMITFAEIMTAVEEDERCVVLPLDANVISLLPTALDIHDAIICGTALVYRELLGEEAKVVTKDRQIIAAKVIDTVW